MSDEIKATGYLSKILAPDEHVELIVHQHVLVFLGRAFIPLVLTILIAAGATFLEARPVSGLSAIVAEYGYALMLLPLAVILWRYIVWRNHSYIMTNRRVIQMKGVFDKEVADSVLDKLNDVKTDQTLLGRIFGYGDIEILTASEAGINALKFVSRPLVFKRAMLQAQEALSHHGSA